MDVNWQNGEVISQNRLAGLQLVVPLKPHACMCMNISVVMLAVLIHHIPVVAHTGYCT